jgi:hypothetical protein
MTAASYNSLPSPMTPSSWFFNQDGLLPHERGSLQIKAPRSELASMLA